MGGSSPDSTEGFGNGFSVRYLTQHLPDASDIAQDVRSGVFLKIDQPDVGVRSDDNVFRCDVPGRGGALPERSNSTRNRDADRFGSGRHSGTKKRCRLAWARTFGDKYELIAFDGGRSVSEAVQAELVLLGKISEDNSSSWIRKSGF